MIMRFITLVDFVVTFYLLLFVIFSDGHIVANLQ